MTVPAVSLLTSLPPGTRVVVRYRITDGLTDALGDLVEVTGMDCTIATRRGDVVVPLAAVTAAKRVPPPPPRRLRGT